MKKGNLWGLTNHERIIRNRHTSQTISHIYDRAFYCEKRLIAVNYCHKKAPLQISDRVLHISLNVSASSILYFMYQIFIARKLSILSKTARLYPGMIHSNKRKVDRICFQFRFPRPKVITYWNCQAFIFENRCCLVKYPVLFFQENSD